MGAGNRVTVLAGLLGGILACGGGDEAERPRTTPLGHAREARADGPGNEPPVIERVSLDPRDPLPGSEVRATVRAVDPEGDELSFAYEWRLDGERQPADGPALRLEHASKGQELEVRVRASDGESESQIGLATATLSNRRPEILGLRVDPLQEVPRGGTVVVSPHARDADGDSLEFSFHWTVNGRALEEQGESLSTEGLARGDEILVEVVASDGEEESARFASAPVRVGNAPPEIVSSPGSGFEGGVFRYRLEATDPDGDRGLRFRLLSGPEGMTVDPVLGEVHWKPRRDQTGTHTVDVAVEDPSGGAGAQKFEVTVREVEAEQVPAAQEE
jgi:hypothetical protein